MDLALLTLDKVVSSVWFPGSVECRFFNSPTIHSSSSLAKNNSHFSKPSPGSSEFRSRISDQALKRMARPSFKEYTSVQGYVQMIGRFSLFQIPAALSQFTCFRFPVSTINRIDEIAGFESD
jgi:hypothetical protein